MSPRILVLYGTTDGHTAKVATAITHTLRRQGANVEMVNEAVRGSDPCPEDYTAVIVAASVHAGGYQRAVRRWVNKHAAALRGKPTAFVSICLGVLEGSLKTDQELSRIAQSFFTMTGWKPAVFKVVAGALPYTQYNWIKRWMMRRIVAKANGDTDTTRDYEYTNWNDLKAFAIEFYKRARASEPVRLAV